MSPKYNFIASVVAWAPDESGVYALWENDEVIYIGRACGGATIRSRLDDHLQRRCCACAHSSTHYSWELSRYPATREAELLAEFTARAGRLPRCNAEATVAQT